jgi:hypothetical protein
VPRISAVKREAIATPAASSDAPLIRFPVESRSIEISISLFTLDAAAWAIKAPVLVATVSAIFVSPNHNRFYRWFGAQRQGNARVYI